LYLIRSSADRNAKTYSRQEDESDGRPFLFWTGTYFICFFSVFPLQKRKSEKLKADRGDRRPQTSIDNINETRPKT
jgi:hypothetical protein